MKVKTHTFNGKKYAIEVLTEIGGICDKEGQIITILRGNNVHALGSALEEGLHAMEIPDRYLHIPLNKQVIGKSASKVDDLASWVRKIRCLLSLLSVVCIW
jgi:hypothetical protein